MASLSNSSGLRVQSWALHDDDLSALIEQEQCMRYALYSSGTSAQRESVKRKVTEFNYMLIGLDYNGQSDAPLFTDSITKHGQCLSAPAAARLFFAKWAHLKQSSLRSIRSQITSVYAQMDAGLVPWDPASGDIEAAGAKLFIDKVIASAAPPKCHEPLDHEVFRRVIETLIRVREKSAFVSLAFAACGCILRGSSGRPQEAIQARKAYFRPNWIAPGVRDGFNVFFPEVDASGKKVSFKGKSDAKTRFKVIPERLSDGLHIANIIEDYLKIAPDRGPLFQTSVSLPGGGIHWSGKPWDTGVITEKLRKVLRDPIMGLDWPEETVRLFSAHSFRATAATSMAAGGADLPLISTALNHKSTGVTLNHYVHYSKECVRRGLALTGPQGFVRHRARGAVEY